MSNRKRSHGTSLLDDLAARIGDQRVPGGCDDCDAYQTMTRPSPGVFSVTVHHDSSCPWLLRSRRSR